MNQKRAALTATLCVITALVVLGFRLWPSSVFEQSKVAPYRYGLGPERTRQPNFVVIVLDDADAAMFSDENLEDFFPNIGRIAREGIRFTNCHVSTPICAPSRASFLRGQYAHRTGVRVNDETVPAANGFSGSYSAYVRGQMQQDDASIWLKRLGYRTMLVGKYLHNSFDFRVPPGWDDFYCSLSNNYFGTSRFTNQLTPEGATTTLPSDKYRTEAEADDAVRLIAQHGDSAERPFFLYLTPIAPHDQNPGGERTEARYRQLFSEFEVQATPDFNEAELQRKPRHFESWQPLNDTQLASVRENSRERMRAVKSADDMVGRIVAALRDAGQLENTYIIFSSDNGFLLGHHRLFGKCAPYTRATNVPLFVRGPGIQPGQSAEHLIAQLDVAPTLLELAGGTPPGFVDGKSFAPLLHGADEHDAKLWREPILLEHWEVQNSLGRSIPMVFTGLRSFEELYVEWADGDTEFYDLATDPWELDNKFNTLDVPRRDAFRKEMTRIKRGDSAPDSTATVQGDAPLASGRGEYVVSGYAESNCGLAGTQIVVQDPGTSRYWNGHEWQSEPAKLAAELRCPGGLLSLWTYGLKFRPDEMVDVNRLDVTAVALDTSGAFSEPSKLRPMLLDLQAPRTKLLRPRNRAKMAGFVFLSGVSFDRQVAQVQCMLRDARSGRFWNGKSFQDDPARFSISPAKSGAWHYRQAMSPGTYEVWARAVDAVGNVEEPAVSAIFEVTNLAVQHP